VLSEEEQEKLDALTEQYDALAEEDDSSPEREAETGSRDRGPHRRELIRAGADRHGRSLRRARPGRDGANRAWVIRPEDAKTASDPAEDDERLPNHI